MIARRLQSKIVNALGYQAAVAIVGPRQVGKTTLAMEIGSAVGAVYLDLEDRGARAILSEPRHFLQRHADRLVILDEIHRTPGIFRDLRDLIDQGRREGRGVGRFLILGSASANLLLQSGETLAGRAEYVELGPFDVLEHADSAYSVTRLWIRGGYPISCLADSDQQSFAIRKDFLRTYLEREIAAFAPGLPAATLERLWLMLAHSQGGLLNAAGLAKSLAISAQSVNRYIDLLVDLLLVRRLPAWVGPTRKRLVRAPKTYIRDSGLLHALLGLPDFASLMGHPVAGTSWEGFAIENLLAAAPERTLAGHYRTAAGAEADLVLDLPNGERWAVAIRRGLAPMPSKGFHYARQDLQATRSFCVYLGKERYPQAPGLEVIGLRELAAELAELA